MELSARRPWFTWFLYQEVPIHLVWSRRYTALGASPSREVAFPIVAALRASSATGPT